MPPGHRESVAVGEPVLRVVIGQQVHRQDAAENAGIVDEKGRLPVRRKGGSKRRKVIDDLISERAKEIWERIAPDYGITLEEWNHDVDHVHVMFRAQPKSELSKFINAYKSASSRLLKKEYPQIRERLWKEAFWSQSFCLLTAGGAPIDIIRNYIETQGEKKR